jgi:hypothetical protein
MDYIVNLFGLKQSSTTNKVNFEDIQFYLKQKQKNCLLINVLEAQEQKCLIKGTTSINEEIQLINNNLYNPKITIIIYGKNSCEDKIIKKYNQLQALGFINIYVYTGGLFEWLLLQDIYGKEEFPTTSDELDILKYKGSSVFTNNFLKDLD